MDRTDGMRSVLRLAVWNVGLLLAGLVLIAAAGEAWLRLTKPFMRNSIPMGRFVPGTGFWTASRANRWGFLDRDPPPPGRAAASCHVSVIGDSFVHAMQVPVADKLHVRLEALAARRWTSPPQLRGDRHGPSRALAGVWPERRLSGRRR